MSFVAQSSNYTKLTMLSFLYCFIVKGKSIWAKCLFPVEIEPTNQNLSIFIPMPDFQLILWPVDTPIIIIIKLSPIS